METKSQTELLQNFCESHSGEHYTSINLDDAPAAWDNHWPVVDANGDLTGDVVESGDPDADEYANVDDAAMVLITDLPEAQQHRIAEGKRRGTWGGYADMPSVPTDN